MSDTQLTTLESDKLRELESEIRSGLQTFREVGSALLQIRDDKLYRSTHNSFEDYCDNVWDMAKTRAYQLMDSARVMQNLTVAEVTELPANERQVRPLTELPADKQPDAWAEAMEAAPDGKPTGDLIQKIVDKIMGKGKGGSKTSTTTTTPATTTTTTTTTTTAAATSWSKDEVKADKELMGAMVAIAAIYGMEDTRAIREGKVDYTRKDVLALAKVPPEKMRELRDVIFETKWKPAEATKFLAKMPDEHTTIGELMKYCLATKGKSFQGDFDGFHLMFTLKRAVRR